MDCRGHSRDVTAVAPCRRQADGGPSKRTGGIASLKHEISGLIAVTPEGKIAWAAAISPQTEAPMFYLRHPMIK